MKKSNLRKTSAKSKRQVTKEQRKIAARKSRRASEEMNPTLRKMAEWMRERILENTVDDATAKYEVAIKVREVIDGEATYGSRAVEKLAKHLEVDFQKLYTAAKVARAWTTESAFDKVIALKNRCGLPLTWSHFCVLAKVEDSAKREKLLDKALKDGLSVRELRAELPTSKSAKTTSDEPKVSTKTAIVSLSKKAKQHTEELTHWRESLTELPVEATSPALKKSLEAAIGEHEALAAACGEAIKAMKTVLHQAEHVEKKPKATVTPIKAAA